MTSAEDGNIKSAQSRTDPPRFRRTDASAHYDAFVSYSHEQDNALADALQSELQSFARPWYRPRALRIFRDETNLSATPGLWPTIERALEISDWFILMASPASASSPWVQKELQWWAAHRDADRILIALTDGEIRWSGSDFDWSVTNAIPSLLSGTFSQEPFWIDLRKLRPPAPPEGAGSRLRLGDMVAEFAAPIHGRDKDTLVGEHVRYHRRTRRLVRTVLVSLTTLLIAAVVAAFVAIVQANNANIQRREAITQRDIATSRQLAANAELAAATDPQLAALLASAAFTMRDTPEARTSMLHQLSSQSRRSSYRERFLGSHVGPIRDISFSNDGQTLLTGGDKVALWNWETGTQRGILPIKSERVASNPRTNTVAVLSGDKVILWDVARQIQLADFPAGAAGGSIAFSPDGKRIAIGGINFTTIDIWNIDERAKIASLTLPPSPDAPQEGMGYRVLTFSPDGGLLIADASYQGVVIWNLDSRSVVGNLKAEVPCYPLSLALSHDGQTVAAGCAAHSAMILIWNLTRGTELTRLQADGDVDSLAFSPDDQTLASGDAAKHVTLWDARKFTRLDTLEGHTDEVNAVAFSPDGAVLASASNSNITIWRMGTRDPIPSVALPAKGTPVAFDPAGRLLAVQSGKDGANTTVVDIERHVQIDSLSGAVPLGFAADGALLLRRNESLGLWKIGQGQQIRPLNIPPTGTPDLANPKIPASLSSDGSLLVTTTGDGTTLELWNIIRNERMATPPIHRDISSVALSPDARTVVVAESGGPIAIWDVRRATKIAQFAVETLGGQIVNIALSGDGNTLASVQPGGQPQTASGCFGCEVILWDLRQRAKIAALSGHTIKPESVAFSPDGRTLVSAAGSETILWSVPQRARMATLTTPVGPVVFSPDGHTLAANSTSGNVTLWDVNPASWRRKLCAIAGRDLTDSEWTTYVPEIPYRAACTN
jgi:WD40 repeat protein